MKIPSLALTHACISMRDRGREGGERRRENMHTREEEDTSSSCEEEERRRENILQPHKGICKS
jgi:hypothetical protein